MTLTHTSPQTETRILKSYNPATGDLLGQVAVTSAEELARARHDMRVAAALWAAKPLAKRVAILRRFKTVLIDASDEITGIISRETGKPRQDALTELFITVDVLHRALNNAHRWLRREWVNPGLYLSKLCWTERRPWGTVAVISPWNFPFVLAMQPVLNALLAGNTVLLKPSEETALTGLLMERLFRRVPDLAPFVRVLHGDGATGAALVQSKPDLIYVTGSTRTGRLISMAAAEHLIPVITELGGKDALIVLEDADLASAAHWAVWAGCFNAGQACAGIERIYATEAVYDRFLPLLAEEARRFSLGYSEEINSPWLMGPLMNERQAAIVDDQIADAVEKGGDILTGGERRGLFLPATVIANADHTMRVMQEETFGPLLPVMRVKDEEEAIRLANDSIYGLGASVWGSPKRAVRVLRRIDAGTLVANDALAHFAVPYLPFGGVKQSGTGRSHGRNDLRQFTRIHSWMVSTPPIELDPAVALRRAGNYRLGEAIMQIVFGSPRQKIIPLHRLATGRRAHAARERITALFAAVFGRIRPLLPRFLG
jgi:acyl-CoA reductase-like NAD-dependent aldehyde dehydrogenase